MSGSKDGNTRIPMLKREEYTHWRVKMLHYLEAKDSDFLDRINKGPWVPQTFVAQTSVDDKDVAEHYVNKPKEEWTKEDKEDVRKDAKVKDILFNSLDTVLTNYVISCNTAQEMWETLKVHCEGTKHVKKNLKSLLIQQYEYFEANSGETLTETYDRFTKLLNEMSIHGKKYDNEDVITKFLRALPEECDEKSTAIREANDLDEITLEDVYGKLRAYDLEKQQRKTRKDGRTKSVALTIQADKERYLQEQTGESMKKDSAREKKKVIQDSESGEEETSDEASEIDMGELLAMFARNFKRGKFNKKKFFKKAPFNTEDKKLEKGKSTIIKIAFQC